MKTVGIFKKNQGIGLPFSKGGGWWLRYSRIITALWYKVEGTEMIEAFGGSPLTLSSDPGQDYIPGNFAGTITAPDVAAYKADDVNNVLYDATGDAYDLTAGNFVSTDLPRILVNYKDASPHDIYTIALLDDAYYASLSVQDKMDLSNRLNLWVFFWGGWLDAGSVNKENRTF